MRSRRSRTTAWAGVAVLAALAALAGPGAQAAEVADDPARVFLTTLEPRAPRADGTVTVEGTITAVRTDLENARVRLRIGDVIRSRGDLARADRRPRPTSIVGGDGTVRLGDTVAAGDRIDFRISVPVADLGLTTLGVYPLRVDVYGTADGDRDVLGGVTTYLPWFPDDVRRRVRLAWVLPLVTAPQRGPGGVFRNDELATELSGRLRALLDAGAAAARVPAAAGGCDPETPGPAADEPLPAACPVQVAWAPDPDLLETVDFMASRRYQVSTPAGRKPGDGRDVAVQWLTDVRTALAGAPVLAMPYADPDVMALTRAGQTTALTDAIELGDEVLGKAVKDVATLRRVSWPADGLLSDDGLAALDEAGTRTVLLSDEGIERVEEPYPSTPDARVEVRSDEDADDGFDALVADSRLTELLAAGEPDGARLAEQRFLAETALITAEFPNGGRTARHLLVVPPRQWAPSAALARNLLADAGRLPWLAPGSLPGLLSADLEDPPLAGLDYPADVDAELPTTHVTAVTAETDDIREFADVLDDDDLVTPLLHAAVRALSSAWRPGADGLAGGRDLRQAVAQARIDLSSKLQIVEGGRVLLGSSGGVIPVTLVNELPEPVTVRLQLDAGASATVDQPADPITLAASSRQQIRVNAEARTPGLFVIRAQLVTPDGRRPVGPEARLLARSTAYGRVAIGITGAALGLLLVLTGVRITRRALRARRPS